MSMSEDIPSLDLKIRGIFNDLDSDELPEKLEEFYEATGIEPHVIFKKGILLCENPEAFSTVRKDRVELTEDEKKAVDLDREQCKVAEEEEGKDADRGLPRSSARKTARFLPHIHGNDLSKWQDLPWPLWKLIILCAIGAMVQGLDEIVINGAQIWYQATFDIFIDPVCDPSAPASQRPLPTRTSIAGLVASGPYLCSVLSCWFTPWLSRKLGRRGTVFWCAIFSLAFALGQAFVQKWQHLLALRILLGLGIGPKSVIIPIYIAECVPANIRGSLVMWWQVFTAFGIMAGSVACVALHHVGQAYNSTVCPLTDRQKLVSMPCSLVWRLLLASPAIPAGILALYIYGCCESPRWTVAKAHERRLKHRRKNAKIYYQQAFKDLNEMSRHRLLAARDMISHFFLLREEKERLVERQEKHPGRPWLFHEFSGLFLERRNRRAILASCVLMFAQQFCGVNVIIYYSIIVFRRMSTSERITSTPTCYSWETLVHANQKALFYTMGFGIINLLFAAPSFFLIDTVGRRSLLLGTFPLLFLSHIITAIGLASGRGVVALTGMYLFGIFYSSGEGPVPFVYAAESMPLHIRNKGMAFVASINWLFNWLIAFTGPWFINHFRDWGTFFWYAAWCFILFFAILLLVPETRCLTLEELDYVFREVKASKFADHAWRSLLWRVHYLAEDEKPPKLYGAEPTRPEREESIPLRRSKADEDPHSSGTAVDQIECVGVESVEK